jgi:hypothetical protein
MAMMTIQMNHGSTSEKEIKISKVTITLSRRLSILRRRRPLNGGLMMKSKTLRMEMTANLVTLMMKIT